MLINEQSTITLHFSIALEDGALVDSTFERDAPSFTYGDGSLLAGFERRLIGLSAGDKQVFAVPPEDAFGQPNPSNMQEFKRDSFAPDTELVEGLVLSFADAQKAELPGVVKTFNDEFVTVDFNHPLAGHTLTFTVEIVAVN
jgi:FKBP-type peptidyl-prolyl cis-trans isomerase SlpA